jgi:hypothetical protein
MNHIWCFHAAALAVYAALALLLVSHGASPLNTIYGMGSDPLQFIWCLAWWPFALLHHMDPLHTHLIWQPGGLDLVWTTCIPFLTLLAMPLPLLGRGRVCWSCRVWIRAVPACGKFPVFGRQKTILVSCRRAVISVCHRQQC